MSILQKSLIAVPALLALAAAGAAVGADDTATSEGPEPVRCEITVSRSGGMVALEALVHAKTPVSGSYRFRVTGAGGAGSTDIRQGGPFAADAGVATLGRVTLGDDTTYNADLEITWNGSTVTCAERIGGAI